MKLTPQQFRAEINRLLVQVEPHELSERIRKELRRNYDSNTTNRARKLAGSSAMREWAKKHLIDDFSDKPPGVLAQDAFNRFVRDTGHRLDRGGTRCFYQALRQAGFAVDAAPGYHVRIRNVEFAA